MEAVCVYHNFVEAAVKALDGSGIPVAAVSAGFPAGLSPLAERVQEIHRSVEAGASEIDIVITRAVPLAPGPCLYTGMWVERMTCWT
jgi:deoxyribose-phosphate aldolase